MIYFLSFQCTRSFKDSRQNNNFQKTFYRFLSLFQKIIKKKKEHNFNVTFQAPLCGNIEFIIRHLKINKTHQLSDNFEKHILLTNVCLRLGYDGGNHGFTL